VNDGFKSAGEEVGLDAHVEQTTEGTGGAAGVKGAEDEMAGEGGLEESFGGFGIADFADENDFGVLPHEGAEAGGEGEAGLRLYLRLTDAGNGDFDGVFERDDVA